MSLTYYIKYDHQINNCTGAEISQLIFLEPYPILLVKDNMFAFTAIPINVQYVISTTTNKVL